MKKNTQSNLAKRLTKYGALSLALAGISDASGQIVFTDVDPSFVGGTGDTFSIDLDENGTDDLIISQSEIITNVGNPVIGVLSSGFYYAANLELGATVSSGQNFVPTGDLCYGGGGFTNSFCQVVEQEGFIGFSFDIDGATHFGWASLEAVDAFNFTVTGIAYNATADASIFAGSQDELSLEDNIIEGLSSFVANNALTINARNPLENITIHNISGQAVISKKLSSSSETVDLNTLSTGVYIATIQTEGASTAIKFVR